ncbi:Uncharacterised protein [Kocuria rosea]|jgi:hypothetical protein|nr:Uncharacterised protein [Kocuria rosea]
MTAHPQRPAPLRVRAHVRAHARTTTTDVPVAP